MQCAGSSIDSDLHMGRVRPEYVLGGRHDAGIQHEDEFLTFIGLHPDVMDLFIGEREGLIGELCAHRGQDST